MRYNAETAKEVIWKLITADEQKTHLARFVHQESGDAPQHKNIPEGVARGSLIHRVFLYFATLITYHSESEKGFQQAVKLFRSFPQLFTSAIVGMEVEEIQEALSSVGFIYPNEAGRRWKLSGQTLFEEFDGEPLRIFELGNINDIIAFKKKRKNLVGYGPKLLSLLALFYEELGLIGHVRGAFPVDVHVQAQCIGTGIIEFNGDGNLVRTERVAEALRGNLSVICYEENISPLKICHSMWFLGNRMCRYCKKRNREQRKALCPIGNFCRGRINTRLYRTHGVWDTRLITYPLFEGR